LKTNNSITSTATSHRTNRTNHPISAETPLVRFVVNLHTDATTMVVYKVKYGTNVQQDKFTTTFRPTASLQQTDNKSR